MRRLYLWARNYLLLGLAALAAGCHAPNHSGGIAESDGGRGIQARPPVSLIMLKRESSRDLFRAPTRHGQCTTDGITDEYDIYFINASRRYMPIASQHDWCSRKAQCFEESGLRAGAESPVGALGICQFMEPTWQELRTKHPGLSGRRNPKANIEANAIYMASLYSTWYSPRPERCREEYALASYNVGVGFMIREISRPFASPICLTDEQKSLLPEETQGYLTKIKRTLGELQGVR